MNDARPVTGPAGAAAILGSAHRLGIRAAVLDSALRHWSRHPRAVPAREAAGTALRAIDAMLRELSGLRQALVAEIRAYDEDARRSGQLPAGPARAPAKDDDSWLYR